MISSVASWMLSSVWEKKRSAPDVDGRRNNDLRCGDLIFRDQRFIQWKPTVFNWVLALVFLGSHFIGQRTVLQRLLGAQLSLPSRIWKRLSALWIGNFLLVGALNLVVAYQYEESFWVAYKLYSSIGFTLLLMLLTFAIVAPNLKDQGAEGNARAEDSS